jgi:hypothetical protein
MCNTETHIHKGTKHCTLLSVCVCVCACVRVYVCDNTSNNRHPQEWNPECSSLPSVNIVFISEVRPWNLQHFRREEAKYLEVYEKQTIYSGYKYVWPEAQCCEEHWILLWAIELSVVFCMFRNTHKMASVRYSFHGSSHLLCRWSENRLYCHIQCT